MGRLFLLLCVCSVGCKPEDSQRTTVAGNTPLKPLPINASATGKVKTCWNDVECDDVFSHCSKDRPEDIGVCTRACTSRNDCTDNASWTCETGVWNTSTRETRSMCMLTCVNDAGCPRGLSCNDYLCGTPCTGPNCDCGETSRQCDSDGNVVELNACGIKSAETCTTAQTCVAGFCKTN